MRSNQKTTQQNRPDHGLFFNSRADDENENADNKYQVKNDCGRPVHGIAKKGTKIFSVEVFSYKAKPDHIDGKKHNGG